MDGESGLLAANALPRDIPFVAPESLIPFPSTALNAITLSLAKDLAKDGRTGCQHDRVAGRPGRVRATGWLLFRKKRSTVVMVRHRSVNCGAVGRRKSLALMELEPAPAIRDTLKATFLGEPSGWLSPWQVRPEQQVYSAWSFRQQITPRMRYHDNFQ